MSSKSPPTNTAKVQETPLRGRKRIVWLWHARSGTWCSEIGSGWRHWMHLNYMHPVTSAGTNFTAPGCITLTLIAQGKIGYRRTNSLLPPFSQPKSIMNGTQLRIRSSLMIDLGWENGSKNEWICLSIHWAPLIKLESVESCALNRFMAVR